MTIIYYLILTFSMSMLCVPFLKVETAYFLRWKQEIFWEGQIFLRVTFWIFSITSHLIISCFEIKSIKIDKKIDNFTSQSQGKSILWKISKPLFLRAKNYVCHNFVFKLIEIEFQSYFLKCSQFFFPIYNIYVFIS